MFILAIDTSLNSLNIGLGRDGNLISGLSLEKPRQHSAKLCSYIKDILNRADIAIEDIDCFAAVVGPGSFTGIRIAVTTVKAFAYALSKDVVALNTLDLLAFNAAGLKADTIVSVIDGRRENIYFAKYRRVEGGFENIDRSALITLKELEAKLKGVDVILGDGVEVLKRSSLKLESGLNILDKDSQAIKTEHMIKLAFDRYKMDKRENIFDLKPFYIYPKECAVKR
jgi:tRNA threonylcarbamoyladenosine biosynthesis protein TsaB